MPTREPLYDLSTLDMDHVEIGIEEIRTVNLQRFEFEMLQGLLHFDKEAALAIGYRDLKEDEFWTRGHIPGRPVFPGVLQVETAAQTCSYIYRTCFEGASEGGFFGFAGMEEVRFTGSVVPGDRFLVVARARRMRRRLAIFETQGFVGGRQVFEGVVKGAQL